MILSSGESISTQISYKIESAMNAEGISIRDLARSIGCTYEHMRRIVRGESLPSKFLMKAVCAELNLDFRELETLSVTDKIRHKYGTIPLEMAGQNPELEMIERHWNDLTDEHKEDAIAMIVGWAKRDKRSLSD